MAVTIEEVLALLPEMFPGVQQIPLDRIRFNPDNPGPSASDEEIAQLAANIQEVGLNNPVKVGPYKADPLAPGVTLHPANPRLRGDGQPWKVEDFNYLLYSGESRCRAFRLLKRTAIPGNILNPTDEEAAVLLAVENKVRKRGWWADYQSVEPLIKANPNLTQGQIAVKLEIDRPLVNHALQVLPLLNTEARGLISNNVTNSNKGNKGISESAVFCLADLGPERALKPGVRKKSPAGEAGSPMEPGHPNHGPRLEASAQGETQKLWPYPPVTAETQDLVRRTLAVAIDQELTEAGVKALVGWVQEGHKPEDYGKKTQKPEIPTSAHANAPMALAQPNSVAQPEASQQVTAPIGAPPRDDDEDEEPVKPIPWSENSKHPEYGEIPVDRIRLNPTIVIMYQSYLNLDRKVLAMKATHYAPDISVRGLTDEEKAADPEHDYELFDGAHTLKGAQILGWPTLRALVYAIDEWEGVRLHNFRIQNSTPLTWIERYLWIAKRVKEKPEKSATQWAIEVQEDPALLEKVLPILGLINDGSMAAIAGSVHQCYEGLVNMGGYRFRPQFALLLEPLKSFSKDLAKTQKLVEQVVDVAIENEMGEDEIKKLVDWTLQGKDPSAFVVPEA